MSDGAFFVERYARDPVRFVREVLGAEPDTWQVQALSALVDNRRVAVSSGHGIGKTAAVAWTILWFMSTRPNPQIVVTANTKNQLDSKTWRELAKWHKKAKNSEWFEWTSTRFSLKSDPKTWFASAIPWTEENSEAFAGTHEAHVLIVFDEASSIADVIWNVVEGAMTTDGARWIAFGNPTRNTGRFRDCWRKFKHRWTTFQVDSRTAKMADKAQIAQWIEDYGEDSDFVKIRVRGEFPAASSNQLISTTDIDKCRAYTAEGYESLAKVFGVDIARFGDDQNAVCIRQGRKVSPLVKWRGVDTMTTTARIVELYNEHQPDMVFVDGGGVGGGVIDALRLRLPRNKIVEVNFGGSPRDTAKYANKRAEMWDELRTALREAIDTPDDPELREDLQSPEYTFDKKSRLILESKDDMKRRGLASPDCGDALALTYAQPVLVEREPEPEESGSYYSETSWMGA